MKTKKLAGIKAIGLDVDGTLYKMPTKLSAIMGMKVIKWAAEKLGRDEDEFAQEYLERRDNYRSNTLTLNSYGLNGEEIFQKVGLHQEICFFFYLLLQSRTFRLNRYL